MSINNKMKPPLFVIGLLLLASFTNGNELKASVTTIDAENTSTISIGSEKFIIPTLPGFSKIDNNQGSLEFLNEHTPTASNIPIDGVKKLIIFEKENQNSRIFINISVAKELANTYTSEKEFEVFKKIFIRANKTMANMLNDKEYSKGYLEKTFKGKIVDMSSIDNGVINQNNIINLSSSYLVASSTDTSPSLVKDTFILIRLKGKIMSIAVSNISESNTDIKGTFELAKEFTAQFIALNEGRIKIIQSQLLKTTPSQVNTPIKEDNFSYLEEFSKVKELLDSGVINKEEFKMIKGKIINKF